MRFSAAWADIAKQNVSLKFALLSLSVVSIFLSIGFLKSSFKDPIVIERACETSIPRTINLDPTVAETKEFVKKALLQRYHYTEHPSNQLLSEKVVAERKSENIVFAKKSVEQLAIVRSVDVSDKSIIANVDRIFSMGEARPAYASKMNIEIQAVSRSIENPYGLVLSNIEIVSDKDKGGQ